jgi:hypothetical protein
MIAKGLKNASLASPRDQLGDNELLGVKRQWREQSRTARVAHFYVRWSAHGPYKSGELPSGPPFPA